MTISLVTKPWIRIIANTMMDPDALFDFMSEHGLDPLDVEDENGKPTPIHRIANAVQKNGSHGDLLSEFAGRFCYRSWDKGRDAPEYLENVLTERHGNVFGHANVSFILTGVSRSLTHELIRHHVGTNPSQESQRYVTAEGGELEVIGFRATRAVIPPLMLKAMEDEEASQGHAGSGNMREKFREAFAESFYAYHLWLSAMKERLPAGIPATIKKKRAQEAARCFLPNATETRLVWTMNLRAARNVVEQRGDTHADLEIRRLAVGMTRELQRVAPLSFQDVEVYTADDGFGAVRVKHSKV